MNFANYPTEALAAKLEAVKQALHDLFSVVQQYADAEGYSDGYDDGYEDGVDDANADPVDSSDVAARITQAYEDGYNDAVEHMTDNDDARDIERVFYEGWDHGFRAGSRA